MAVNSASPTSGGPAGGTILNCVDDLPAADPAAPGSAVDGSTTPSAAITSFQGALNKAAGAAAPTAGVATDSPPILVQAPGSEPALDPVTDIIQVCTAADAPTLAATPAEPVAAAAATATATATNVSGATNSVSGGATKKLIPGRADALEEAMAQGLVAIPALSWSIQLPAPVASDTAPAATAIDAAAAPSAAQADSTGVAAGGAATWLNPAAGQWNSSPATAPPLPVANTAADLLPAGAARERLRWRDATVSKALTTATAVTAERDSNALSVPTSRAAIAVNALSAALLPVRDRTDTSAALQDQTTDTGATGAANTWGLAPPLAQATTAATTATADITTRTIELPVQHPRWATAVAAEVRWFAEQGVQGATLRLTPEHLGPVEVRLDVSDGQVNVNFSAAHAETRTALEQSIPQLREMLAGAGLSLGEAQVQQQARHGSQNSFNAPAFAADNELPDSTSRMTTRLGLVDEFA